MSFRLYRILYFSFSSSQTLDGINFKYEDASLCNDLCFHYYDYCLIQRGAGLLFFDSLLICMHTFQLTFCHFLLALNYVVTFCFSWIQQKKWHEEVEVTAGSGRGHMGGDMFGIQLNFKFCCFFFRLFVFLRGQGSRLVWL